MLGCDIIADVRSVPVHAEEKVTRTVAPTPKSGDPATLIRHLESNEPVKLALARDLPLTIRTVEKTARGIKKMMDEKEGQESLHKGLGWLHYRKFHSCIFSPTLRQNH